MTLHVLLGPPEVAATLEADGVCLRVWAGSVKDGLDPLRMYRTPPFLDLPRPFCQILVPLPVLLLQDSDGDPIGAHETVRRPTQPAFPSPININACVVPGETCRPLTAVN